MSNLLTLEKNESQLLYMTRYKMLTKETEEGIKPMCTVISVDKGGPATMFDAFEAVEKRGEARGEAIGKARILKLLKQLYALGRDADAKRAITDEQYLAKLMKGFAIQ